MLLKANTRLHFTASKTKRVFKHQYSTAASCSIVTIVSIISTPTSTKFALFPPGKHLKLNFSKHN